MEAEYRGLKVQKRIVSVLPLEVVLPSKSILLPVGEILGLKVIGGSGYYTYTSKNKEVAEVSYEGEVESRREGEAVIFIVDQRNKMNFIEVKVRVEGLVP